MPTTLPIKRALISVSDKTKLIEFANQLTAFNIEILSTGGTAKFLREQNISVIEINEYTQFPEILAGRVKSLHPKIHGGILAKRGIDDKTLLQHQINPIDLVVVNLYPFTKTIDNPNCKLDEAIENIDIGGPTLLRAAAKNFNDVTVINDFHDYDRVINEMRQNHGATTLETRFYLAKKVFLHTAEYDAAISNYLNTYQNNQIDLFPSLFLNCYEKKQNLRYGENPHQAAALYLEKNTPTDNVAQAKQRQGKELSYNNIADADAALECVRNFTDNFACVIVKHANPCGVAVAATQVDAYLKAFATDPTSAFGGIIAFNQPLSEITAQTIIKQQFVEVIIAPQITDAALAVLQQKPSIRVLSCEHDHLSAAVNNFDYKKINGGMLIQQADIIQLQKQNLKIVTQRAPTDQEMQDLYFAWNVAKFVKSNAIVFAKNEATIGIGAGQMSRVDSVMIAAHKAKQANLSPAGSVMASDAFFPFRDGIDQATAHGITAIIQPGGSIRDEEIIQAANEAGVAMVFTGIRHFRH